MMVIDYKIPRDDLKKAFLATIPKDVHPRVRWVWDGPGLRLRDCSACGIPVAALDPVFGGICFVMWAHLDPDKLNFPGTIQGQTCRILRQDSQGKGPTRSSLRSLTSNLPTSLPELDLRYSLTRTHTHSPTQAGSACGATNRSGCAMPGLSWHRCKRGWMSWPIVTSHDRL